ncbi:receptor activity-modifying protein 3 [Echeneis naucrates]|uniref:Receptor activity-modifying protein 3-like n=1 Tax=Echeneis naucrates TaxID=173247 RepID=A0A665UEM9_ECHNA|nr:receptor activity-modifying protein 3-like [Echeneis naucrates]
MILYLLVPLLLVGSEESQAANGTQEWTEAERRQTFSSYNSTITPGDVMSRELSKNETSLIITEDNENFQDPNMNMGWCNRTALVEWSNSCWLQFHDEMRNISQESWCQLDSITRPYSKLTSCIEMLCGSLKCYYPNSDTQDFFLQIHSIYFHNCTREELLLEDAPHWLVMVLTLIPVGLIPVLVYVVVWKSKVQE